MSGEVFETQTFGTYYQELISIKNENKLVVDTCEKITKGDDKEWVVVGNKFKK